jgi:hypothetical protein
MSTSENLWDMTQIIIKKATFQNVSIYPHSHPSLATNLLTERVASLTTIDADEEITSLKHSSFKNNKTLKQSHLDTLIWIQQVQGSKQIVWYIGKEARPISLEFRILNSFFDKLQDINQIINLKRFFFFILERI